MLPKSEYDFLMKKPIIEILDGDACLDNLISEDKIHNGQPMNVEIHMPYLSGPDICNLSEKFGSPIEYDIFSRWSYMQEMFEKAKYKNKTQEILSYLFSKTNFSMCKNISDLSVEMFEEYYQKATTLAIKKINNFIDYTGDKLIIKNNNVFLKSDLFEIKSKYIQKIDRTYIKEVQSKANENLRQGNFDSVLTQARTLLEEVFMYVLEVDGIQPSRKGNIKKLYGQVKLAYSMSTGKDVDKRINELLSGLENIVDAIAEMRNKESDAHGLGRKRIKVEEHHARLALNAALTMADFILSVSAKNISKRK